MSINSIGTNSDITALSAAQLTTTQLSTAGSMLPSDSAQMSPMASSLNQLQQLQQTDPPNSKPSCRASPARCQPTRRMRRVPRHKLFPICPVSSVNQRKLVRCQTCSRPASNRASPVTITIIMVARTLIKAPAQRPALEHLLAPVHRQATKISLQSTWRRSFRRLCSSRVNRRLRDGKSQLRVYLGPVLRRRHGFADQFQDPGTPSLPILKMEKGSEVLHVCLLTQ